MRVSESIKDVILRLKDLLGLSIRDALESVGSQVVLGTLNSSNFLINTVG